MRITIRKINKKDWETHCAAVAHETVFGHKIPPEYDRVDFALMVLDADKDQAVAYMTVREFDAETAYLKHGGAFPPMAKTVCALPALITCLKWLKERYKRITTLVENTNVGYLKMALTAGFKIIGIRFFENIVLVELYLEGGI